MSLPVVIVGTGLAGYTQARELRTELAGAAGTWQIQESAKAGEARHADAEGRLLGLASLDTATRRRQALAAQLPAVLAA